MRLLLTRAADDAARTRTRLEALGHRVLVSPALTIIALPVAWPKEPPTALLATSARAFTGDLQQLSPLVKAKLPLFMVGRRTLGAARREGFRGPATVAADSAALIPKLLLSPDLDFVYLAGRDRKGDIESRLKEVGRRLRVLETYKAEAAIALMPEASNAFLGARLDAVLHYSRRSAEIFLRLMVEAGLDATSCTHLCLAEEVAVPFRRAGCPRVVIPTSPDEDAMVAALPAVDPLEPQGCPLPPAEP